MIKELQRLCDPMLTTPENWLAWKNALESAIEARDASLFGVAIEMPSMRIEDGVAIIPIDGPVARGVSGMEKLFGVVDMQDIGAELAQAEANPDVRSIVLEIDSPGGTVNGTPELARQIANSSKPTFAFSSGLAASAGYYLMAAADNVVVTPSAKIGHIGTFIIHQDISDALAAEGVVTTIIASDSLKMAGHPLAKMTEEHREHLASQVMEATGMFRGFVAEHRPGMAADEMRGQIYFGEQAVSRSFADATAQNISEVIQLAQ